MAGRKWPSRRAKLVEARLSALSEVTGDLQVVATASADQYGGQQSSFAGHWVELAGELATPAPIACGTPIPRYRAARLDVRGIDCNRAKDAPPSPSNREICRTQGTRATPVAAAAGRRV